MDTMVVAFANGLWIRLSAQAYNSLREYLNFGEIIMELRELMTV
jgi:hypothetical protein